MDPVTAGREKLLPYPKWLAIVAGAVAGVVLRLIFSGGPGEALEAMTGGFIYLAPVTVSAVTIYIAERQSRQSWVYYFLAGLAANVLFVLGTLAIMIEGLICAIVIVPLFAISGGVAGVLIGALYRLIGWPRQASLCLAALPLLVAAVPITPDLPPQINTIERSVLIEAPRALVWQQLLHIDGIRGEEIDDAIAVRIGVPPPISASSLQSPDERVRRVRMGKDVYFDQIELEREEGHYIRWRQRFYRDSFPPGAFDHHVVMGGSHFDIGEVSYRLSELGGRTQLQIRMSYRVSTHFNWYADWVARIVLGDLAEHLISLYRSRATAAASGEA